MAVIKAGAPQPDLAAFSLADIEQEAAALLESAESQAAALLDETRRSAAAQRARAREEGLAEGRERGFQEGLAEGREAGMQQAIEEQAPGLAQLAAALAEGLGRLEAAREGVLSASGDDVARLAIAIAQRVCGELGRRDPTVCARNVAAALKLVGPGRDIRLCVHPADAEHLRAILPDLQRRHPSLASLDLTADLAIAPGGCRIEAGPGVIDAELSTQLDRIAADLLGSPVDGN